MPASGELSGRPTEILIRDLIRTRREETLDETKAISRRIATAPFPSAREHLERRIVELQWHPATTEQQYSDDVRHAALDESARIAVYFRRGGHLAAVIAQSGRILPAGRTGEKSLPLFFVVYSADRGIILTGYQASSPSTIALPGDAQWLK